MATKKPATRAKAAPKPASRHWSDVVSDEVRSLEGFALLDRKGFYRGGRHDDAKAMLALLDDMRRRVAALVRAS